MRYTGLTIRILPEPAMREMVLASARDFLLHCF
jgi:hypothetical protein